MIKYTPIAVAYRKKTGNKIWVTEFTDQRNPDRINAKRGKMLPEGSEIVEMGVGSKFYQLYKNKYK